MTVILSFIIVLVLGMFFIPFLSCKKKAVVVFLVVLINALLTGYFAIQTFLGKTFQVLLPGSSVTGPVNIQMDALSGWFILIINLVFLTGCAYGIFYMKAYQQKRNEISLHWISFLLTHASMISLCIIQNSLAFLLAWEIMAISAFLMVIFEHEKITTLKAGMNYLIQSHVSIVILMFGFIWIAQKTGSYDFSAISLYTSENHGFAGIFLFFCFFMGFAIKAGFVPFHTWLPYAHPAAPAHVSGIMSGVIIKIGIFGILRMISLIKADYTTIGYFILIFSAISGIYGVMLAIVQHNLKKLLAYHSIENIGIIGMGIGLGCLGLGNHNPLLASLGFAGALLHTLNHALFKSLLFYTSGSVYQAAHTLNIEHLGGVIKKMPRTAFLFLIASIAICGLPPLNGFVSEFLIYNGLYQFLQQADLVSLMVIIFVLLALVMIGGLALLCFTKAFGIVFLGTEREKLPDTMKEISLMHLIPLYLIGFFIVLIGIFPQWAMGILKYPISCLDGNASFSSDFFRGLSKTFLQPIGIMAWGFILLAGLLFFTRNKLFMHRKTETGPTWGCGYVASGPKIQYTASSFVRTYSKLFAAILLFFRKEKKVKGVFPGEACYESQAYDKIENALIDIPVRAYKTFMGKFTFLQNGNLQFYILYGILFIFSVISIPLLYDKIVAFIEFLKQV